MSTSLRSRPILVILTSVLPLAIVLLGWLALRGNSPGNMAGGYLAGGLIATAAAWFMMWRAILRPQRASPFERAWTQTGDERDDAVLTRALAVVGLLSFPLVGVAGGALGLGVDPAMTLTLLLLAQCLLLAGSFVVITRRS